MPKLTVICNGSFGAGNYGMSGRAVEIERRRIEGSSIHILEDGDPPQSPALRTATAPLTRERG